MSDLTSEKQSQRNKLLDELFTARVQALYHQERRRFLARFSNILTIVSILAISSAVAAFSGIVPHFQMSLLGSDVESEVALGLLSALVFALDLTLKPALRSGEHAVLARRWVGYEKNVLRLLKLTKAEPEMLTDALQESYGERLEIKSESPPVMRWLTVWCHNQIVKSQGVGEIYYISPLIVPFLNLYNGSVDSAIISQTIRKSAKSSN